MKNAQIVYIAMFGLACVTLMIVTATLMGHNGGLVAGAVGTITSCVGAILGIDQGGKKKERTILLGLSALKQVEEELERAKGF